MQFPRKILLNFSWLASGSMLRRVLFFFTNLVIARRLGPSSFGLISFAYSTMLIFIGIGDFGLHIVGTRRIARHRPELTEHVGQVLTLKLLFAAAAFALLMLVWLFNGSTQTKLLLTLFGIGIFFNSLTFTWPFRGIEQMQYVGFAGAMAGVLNFLLVYLLVHNEKDIYYIPLAFVVSNLVPILLLAGRFVHKHGTFRLTLRSSIWKNLLGDCWPIGLSLVASRLHNSFSVVLLGLLGSHLHTGLFRAPQMIFSLLTFLIGKNLSDSLFPLASRLYRQDHNQLSSILSSSCKVSWIVVVPIAVICYLLAPELLHLFFRKDYLEAAVTFRILCLAAPFAVCEILLRNLLPAFDKQKAYLAFTLGIVTSTTLFALPLIRRYPASGMAAAVAISECLGCIAAAYYITTRVIKLHLDRSVVNSLLAAVPMAVATYLIKQHWPESGRIPMFFITILVGLGIYLATLYAVGTFSKRSEPA